MALEAIKGAALSYQGSTYAADHKIVDFKLDFPKKTDAPEPVEQVPEEEAHGLDDVEDEEEVTKPVLKRDEEGSNNNKQLQEAVEKLKEKLNQRTEAIFGIHEGTNRVMIKIVDKDTKDVLKEYPPEKTLDMIQKVWEMAGIMVDEKR